MNGKHEDYEPTDSADQASTDQQHLTRDSFHALIKTGPPAIVLLVMGAILLTMAIAAVNGAELPLPLYGGSLGATVWMFISYLHYHSSGPTSPRGGLRSSDFGSQTHRKRSASIPLEPDNSASDETTAENAAFNGVKCRSHIMRGTLLWLRGLFLA